jgi:hypothetical protein
MTRDIIHGIEIHAEPKAVFDTIATRSGLSAFWTPDVQGEDSEGGELSFGFSGSPARLPIRVTRLDPPRTIEWGCPVGYPFWEGTRVEWSIDPRSMAPKWCSATSGSRARNPSTSTAASTSPGV